MPGNKVFGGVRYASRAHGTRSAGNALAVDTTSAIKDSIRASFRRLTALYPDAKYADVHSSSDARPPEERRGERVS
jgi:hypothetical protein